MKLVVASRLNLFDATDAIREHISAILTRPNPEYYEAKKLRQPLTGIPKLLPVSRNVKDRIVIPRGCGRTLKAICGRAGYELDDRRISNPLPFTLPLRMEPREYQITIAAAMARKQQGYVIAPCGSGKTNIFIRVIASLRQRTLIVVHTEFLMRQAFERIKAVTGYTAGLYYGHSKDIKDITIGINRSIISHMLGTPAFNSFGCIIVDECDLTPTPTMAAILNASPAKYRFGATATYQRYDKQSIMIDYLIGDRIAELKPEEVASVIEPQVYFVQTGIQPRWYPGQVYDTAQQAWVKDESANGRKWANLGDFQIKSILSKGFAKSRARRDLILRMVRKEHAAGHVILVIAGSHVECETYRAHLTVYGISACIIDQHTDKAAREQHVKALMARECRVLLGVNVVSRGMDIPVIDRIIMTTKKQVKQAIGRGTRPCDGKTDCKVYVLVDAHPNIQAEFRKAVYPIESYYKITVGWTTPKELDI